MFKNACPRNLLFTITKVIFQINTKTNFAADILVKLVRHKAPINQYKEIFLSLIRS